MERKRERENEAHVAVLAWPVGLACAAWRHVPLRCRVCAAAREFLARGAVALGAVNLAGLVLAGRLANLFVAEEPVALAAQATGLVKTRDTAQKRNQGAACGQRHLAGLRCTRRCAIRGHATKALGARAACPSGSKRRMAPYQSSFGLTFFLGKRTPLSGHLNQPLRSVTLHPAPRRFRSKTSCTSVLGDSMWVGAREGGRAQQHANGGSACVSREPQCENN